MISLTYADIAIRLGVAILTGGMVGYEREKKGRDAGFRTHILVAVGACLFALIELETAIAVLKIVGTQEGASQVLNFSVHRLTAQVVSGIGFLGAGTIMLTKRSIKGLTTAASIWVCAALGIASGMGYYVIAGAGALVILLTLVVVKRIFSFPHMKKLTIAFDGSDELMKQVENLLRQSNVRILGTDTKIKLEEETAEYLVEYHIDARHIADCAEFLRSVHSMGPFRQVLLQDLGDDF